MNYEEKEIFQSMVIGQDDDSDYEESGYVAGLKPDGSAYIASYSHCSCFGTWSALGISGGDIGSCWQGTQNELVKMATDRMDPDMAGRKSDPADNDYDHLMKVYDQVIAWDKSGRKSPSNEPASTE